MNAQVRPGYKLTDIGVFPIEWSVKKLGEITILMTNGFVGTATSAYVKSDDGILYVQGFNVEPNSFNFRGIKRVSATFHTQNQKSCLRTGDLLTIQTGDIGTTTLVPPSLAGANCHALVISRLDLRHSSPEFYCQYFNSDEGRAAFKVIETGTTMKHLNVGDMVRLLVPSPPLDEQQAIATALFDMDYLISGLDQLIAKKRDIKQAAMQQLLTGQQRLPGFNGEWCIATLGEICTFENGDRGRDYPSPNSFVTSGVPFINAGHIANGKIDLSEMNYITPESFKRLGSGKIRRGDILFCLRGSIGKFGIVGDFLADGAIASSLVIIRPKASSINLEYLGCYFSSELCSRMIDTWSGGAAQPNLGARDLAKFSIPLPAQQSEQTAIATILSDMESELTTLETRRDKARQLKQGMMQELLTGRIRLLQRTQEAD
ncbi:restriction endonuclease subunit S [Pseudomonas akapageensis]|uniref:restriction endonuclease subunit S n=1 Tax=Pseudomonas akapageensis TaxID=2609961 RepID=UPI00140B72CC|nr:restriction endonuclease subunit S [Pseudomonas akapageensis]